MAAAKQKLVMMRAAGGERKAHTHTHTHTAHMGTQWYRRPIIAKPKRFVNRSFTDADVVADAGAGAPRGTARANMEFATWSKPQRKENYAALGLPLTPSIVARA